MLAQTLEQELKTQVEPPQTTQPIGPPELRANIAPKAKGYYTEIGDWVYSEDIDSFDDTKAYSLIIFPRALDTGYKNDEVYLMLMCLEEHNAFMVSMGWDNHLEEAFKDRVEFTYRIDSQPAKANRWILTGNGKTMTRSTDSNKNLELVKEFSQANVKLLVKVRGYSQDLTAEFDVSGLSEILHQVTQPCGL